ncbi:hypothetical protein [Dactylosporangium salmoneum]|uniref:Flavin reductase n=1 Tax=Dactylosporangium salmoneum TaxID=53361 RepID=A0ABN3FDL3_9ACTN
MAHQLSRPAWRCGCGEPWPCAVRRAQLLEDYSDRPLQLHLLMGGYVADALADLDRPGAPDAETLRRQLHEWLPPRTPGGSR